MKKYLVPIIFLSLLLTGCLKDLVIPECEQRHIGWIEVLNETDDITFEVKVNGDFAANLEPGDSYNHEGEDGRTYHIHALEINTNEPYPLDYDNDIMVVECQTHSLHYWGRVK